MYTESSMPKLGLCCLTSDRSISYRTITKTRFDKLSIAQQESTLWDIYTSNIAMFARAINFCADNDISMYRVTSHLFPFWDYAVGDTVLSQLKDNLATIGTLANALSIRIVIHPDQWVVLSSDNSEVISRSINELIHHATVFDAIGLSQTPLNLINVHGGKGGNAHILVRTINNLPVSVKTRLTLENDERAYGARDLVKVSEQTGIPVLFDFHHSLVKNKLTTYDHKTIAAEFALSQQTWEDSSAVTTHISNGCTSLLDRKHSDFIHRYPECMFKAPWIEVEATAKEQAIVALRSSMLNYYVS